MKKALLAAASVALLAGCAHQEQCVQPDPVEPAHSKCWNKGTDCGTGIQAFEGTTDAAPAKPMKASKAAPAKAVKATKKK